jgi:transposase InsO family protein
VADAIENLKTYFRFYNFDRPHQSLNKLTPAEVYFGIPKTAGRYPKPAILQVGLLADRPL